MPAFQDIQLIPGVNTQFTLEANKAGISVSQNIRYKQSLPQKIGGWSQYSPAPGPVSSTPVRDIHAWEGLIGAQKFVGAGSLSNVTITSCGVVTDLTPQTNDTSPFIGSSIGSSHFGVGLSSGSNVVTISDFGSSAGIYSGVQFNTAIAVGNILLFGLYPINTAIDANTYTILSSNPSNITIGTSQSSAISLPSFSVSSGSAIVDWTLPNNQFLQILGIFYNFGPVSSLGTFQVGGPYEISSIIDSTHFQTGGSNQSQTTVSGTYAAVSNHYYMVQGPSQIGGTYGAGNYGAGQYGFGTAAGQGQGTKITATDWQLDNWGEVLVAFQQNGPIYTWQPNLGLTNMQPIYTGPKFNRGGFVSQPQQILFAYGSEQHDGLRFTSVQDPLIVRWSNSLDYTVWTPSPQNTAGSFHLPTGSAIIGGLQAPNFSAIWTDIDVWTATWAGQPLIWSWLRVGTGCGLIGEHAADVAQGVVYWCSNSFNFFALGPSGVQVLPCTVWDFIFQNIDTANQGKVRAAANSFFNEVSWFFPVAGGTGENTAYVKLHIGEGNEYEWDYGFMSRTAWVDTTIAGPPIGSDNFGNLLQHETSFDAAGTPIDAYLETGYFYMGDGTDIATVDWVIPDIRWQSGSQGSASVPGTLLFTFYTIDYPAPDGGPGASGARAGERVYGPFMVTQATQFINTRMRGRFWRCRIESNDLSTFWRIGNIKFRWGPSGHR